jgi:hypothetical protein
MGQRQRRGITPIGDSRVIAVSHGQQDSLTAAGIWPLWRWPHQRCLPLTRWGIESRIYQQRKLDVKHWYAGAYDLARPQNQDPKQCRCHRQIAGGQARSFDSHHSSRAHPSRNFDRPDATPPLPSARRDSTSLNQEQSQTQNHPVHPIRMTGAEVHGKPLWNCTGAMRV